MYLVDANVLLYAVNEDTPNHEVARDWLDSALGGEETVGFAWLALLAFVRLSTAGRVFPRPLSPERALDIVDLWLAQPPSIVLHPSDRHTAGVRRLLGGLGTAANLVNDAHLATLATEHRATVVSFDTDFARFGAVRWQLPRVA